MNKGIDKEFLEQLNFNDEIYYGLYPEELKNSDKKNFKRENLLEYQNADFLSKVLYYQN